VILLVIGGGSEPRATSYKKKQAEIFEFIKKTEKREIEVKRVMEAIETNLAGTSLVITRQTENIEEGNKTMKGLETGLNKMKTELD
jgi:hypothetical protein